MVKPDIWVKLVYDKQWRAMGRIEQKLAKQVDQAIEASAEALVRDIRSSWSAGSPSAKGRPPAVQTGNLDSSIKIVRDDDGRGISGRFVGKDVKTRTVTANTSEGSNPGNRGNYAMALEDPSYLDRPFFEPALKRLGGTVTSNLKRFVRL